MRYDPVLGSKTGEPMTRSRRFGLAGLTALGSALVLSSTTISGCGEDDSRRGLRAPTMVTASAGNGNVLVSWAAVPGAERYILYVAREPGLSKDGYQELAGGFRIDFEGLTDPPFLVEGLENGTTYFFMVTAVDEDRYESDESGEVHASPSPWGPPGTVEALPGEAIGLVADIDGEGNVHALWARGTGPGRQALHWSLLFDDDGVGTFEEPMALDSAFAISGSPAIAIGDDGFGIALWRQGLGANDAAWAAAFDPINGWDAPQMLTGTANVMARNPSAAIRGGAGIGVWTQNVTTGTSGTITAIFGSGWNGASWTAAERVDVVDVSAEGAKAAFASSGPFVVWPQAGQVWFATFDGAAWSAPIVVSGTNDGAAAVRVAAHETGDAFLLFREDNLSDDLIAVRYDGTSGTWDEPVALEQSPRDTEDMAVAVCETGEAVAVWTETTALRTRLMARRWTADEDWSDTMTVFESPDGSSETPSIAMDGACTAVVVWIQEVVDLGGPGVTKNVYSSGLAIDSGNWTDAVLVSRYGLNSTPVVLIDDDGEITALWEYYGATGEQILFNRIENAPAPE